MSKNVSDLLSVLDNYAPLETYKFGHTPVQMAYFKTSSQQGCQVFEYWHQVLQLKAVREALEDLVIQKDEALMALKDAQAIWPFWNYSKRKRRIPRLELQVKRLQNSIEEKMREASFHYDLLKTKYSQYEHLSEDEILSQDQAYWSYRLGKQLATSRLSRSLGVGEGELSAVLALPQEERQKVMEGMGLYLKETTLLPNEAS